MRRSCASPATAARCDLYRVPDAGAVRLEAADKLPPLERTLGADAEQGLVFLLDKKSNVVALDLETRRVRPYARAGPPGHRGPRRRALRGGHRQQRSTNWSGVARRCASGPSCRASRRNCRRTMGGHVGRLGSRATSPALEVLGSDQPAAKSSRPRRTGGRRASGATSWPWRPTRAVVLYEVQGESDETGGSIPVSGTLGRCCSRLRATGSTSRAPRHGLLVLDRVERRRSCIEIELARPRPRPARRPLRSVAPGPPGHGRLGLGGGRGDGPATSGTVQVEWDADLPASCRPAPCSPGGASDRGRAGSRRARASRAGDASRAARRTAGSRSPGTRPRRTDIPVEADSAALAAAADTGRPVRHRCTSR